MQLEIITPDHKIFDGEATSVQMPGKDGLFEILNNHASIISTLTSGEIKINLVGSHKKMDELHGSIVPDKSDEKVVRVAINGGVIEMQNNKIIVLAD